MQSIKRQIMTCSTFCKIQKCELYVFRIIVLL